jgi:hypothetical protein
MGGKEPHQQPGASRPHWKAAPQFAQCLSVGKPLQVSIISPVSAPVAV